MPDGITILGFKIYFYGILIMLGALAATWVAAYRAKEYGYNGEETWDILPWALVGGIVGARLWHILTPPASMVAQGVTTGYYLTHPLEMLNLRNGGLGIPGAVIGGFIAVWLYVRRHDENIFTWADIIAPGLALAQGIGRWGNFFNQELYGAPTNLPWKLFIAPEKRLPEFAKAAYYHPLFFYEFVWDVVNAGLLVWLSRRFKGFLKRGDLFCIYAAFYGFGRFFLEFLRLDPSPVAGINVNQTLMAVVFVVSTVTFILRHRFDSKEPASALVETRGEDASASPSEEVKL
jgi:phosphatidylglycerol---prolipoprotein diacylglyceryl transferase